MTTERIRPRKLAVMGGAYGNLAALASCLKDAADVGAERRAFIGDSIGCCGHSNEIVSMIRGGFDLFVAGNHEQQAVAGSTSCGVDTVPVAEGSEWVFPASTRSGHIEATTIKKRHKNVCKSGGIEYFPPYAFRHTCLTRLSSALDPYTLAHVAGHADFATTKRYVHPQPDKVRLNSSQLTDSKWFMWCARRDSNPRPTGSKPVALSS